MVGGFVFDVEGSDPLWDERNSSACREVCGALGVEGSAVARDVLSLRAREDAFFVDCEDPLFDDRDEEVRFSIGGAAYTLTADVDAAGVRRSSECTGGV